MIVVGVVMGFVLGVNFASFLMEHARLSGRPLTIEANTPAAKLAAWAWKRWGR